MTEEIAGKIVDAYKTSPLLTGLLLLNIGLFLGMGYYIVRVQQSAGALFTDMQREMILLAKQCGGSHG